MSSSVRQRVQSCFRAKKFEPEPFRGIIIGTMLAISLADAALYKQLRSSITYGQLPWYTADVFIMCIGSVEAISSLFWSSLRRWRLKSLTFLFPLVSVTSLLLIALPSVPLGSGSEFCTNTPPTGGSYIGMTTAGALRLSMIFIIALVNMTGRSAAWNIGVVTLDNTDPDRRSLNFGILLAARALSLIMFPKFLNEDMPLWTQALGVFMPVLLHTFQVYRLPEPELEVKLVDDSEQSDTTILGSLVRILSSGIATGQIFAMALIITPLWGFFWHSTDIMQMLFYVAEESGFVNNQIEAIFYHALLLAVVTYGLYYRGPKFNRVSALKLATFASILVAPLYCTLTLLLSCKPGLVAGLNQNFGFETLSLSYSQPACSSQCRCALPFSGFDPVCVTDTLTTYMSPCHAGCTGQDIIGGLSAYRGCGCAPGSGQQRATLGACNVVNCRVPYILHRTILPVMVILTVLVAQAQVVTILSAVQPQDRSLAVGLSMTVVLLLTFVLGHLAYFGIGAWNCTWSDNGRCLFHNQIYLKAIGGTSTALVGVSAIITLVTWQVIRRRNNKAKEDIPMSRTDNNDTETIA